MARRSPTGRFPALRQGRSRDTIWFNGIEIEQALGTGGTSVLLTALSSTGLGYRPFTIVRARGYMHIVTDQSAAGESQRAAFGMAVVSEQAHAIGVTAVPTPVTDDESGLWFVYEWLLTATIATGIETEGAGMKIDSKAMRKVQEGDQVISVVQSGATSDGLLFQAYTPRLLVKLH